MCHVRMRASGRLEMSKAITIGAVFLLVALIAIGLWDLFRNSNALGAFVALILVAAGIFNTWGALK
jgi:hypothetical protein